MALTILSYMSTIKTSLSTHLGAVMFLVCTPGTKTPQFIQQQMLLPPNILDGF